MLMEIRRDYLTVDEAAEKAEVSPATIWVWLRDERRTHLRRYKSRGRTLVSASELAQWLREYDAVMPADQLPADSGAHDTAPEGE